MNTLTAHIVRHRLREMRVVRLCHHLSGDFREPAGFWQRNHDFQDGLKSGEIGKNRWRYGFSNCADSVVFIFGSENHCRKTMD